MSAGYTKLRRHLWQRNFVVKKPVFIPSWHFCAFTGFQIVIDKIITCKLIIQIFWQAFLAISSDAKYICATSARKCGKPCFPKIRSYIRKQNIIFLKCNSFPRRYGFCDTNSSITRAHVICRNIVCPCQIVRRTFDFYQTGNSFYFQRITS